MSQDAKSDRAAEEDRLAIPLEPEDALRALLQVDPESEPVEDQPPRDQGPSAGLPVVP